MNKIMALDVGTKRIGIALSDYLHVIATPHTTIPRTPEQDAIESILKIAKENNVKTIIVGLPINMDGTKGFQVQDCIDFSQKICGFDIMYEDERLTSEEAENRLRARKVDFRKNKGLVDMESAAVILEQYLGK
ncbi:MAG: Holliday junction resolvase RuvX [bacterium]|nr:Holliday junction resolvase RuvX [bacterium]